MQTSLTTKIIGFYLLVLFAAFAVLGGVLSIELNRIVYREVDTNLLAQAQDLTVLTHGDPEDEAEFRASADYSWEYGSLQSRNFYQIRGRNGAVLERSPSLGDAELPAAIFHDRPVFRSVQAKGIPLRLIDFPLPGGQVIQCAQDVQFSSGIFRHYAPVLAVSLLVILVVSALGGATLSRKALAPLRDMSATMDAISESNLSERIDVLRVPQELRVLASSFNRTVDRLENAFSQQNQFAADASHELRTPLAAILSQSEISLRKERTPAEYKTALIAVQETAERMWGTVRKLLLLNRLREDRRRVQQEDLDLGALLAEAIGLVRPLAEKREVRLLPFETAGKLRVQGERSALLELFGNLLHNAVLYNLPQGTVQVTAVREGAVIRCAVQDTGIGIPEGARDKVFDRFYRVDPSRSQEREGSGLGLSICKEIADLHHGRIAISDARGGGTIVAVFLPAVERESVSEG